MLLAIGTSIAPLFYGYAAYDSLLALSTVNYSAGRYQWLAVFDIASSSIFAGAWGYTAWLLFTEKRSFPAVWIAVTVLGIARIIIMISWMQSLELGYSTLVAPLAQAIVAALIWIPYLLISRRVSSTFVG